MAHHSATKKAIIQTAKRTERNRALRSTYRTAIKKLEAAVDAGDKKSAPELLKAVQIRLSKSVSKGVIKQETASRKLSRLNASVKQLVA